MPFASLVVQKKATWPHTLPLAVSDKRQCAVPKRRDDGRTSEPPRLRHEFVANPVNSEDMLRVCEI